MKRAGIFISCFLFFAGGLKAQADTALLRTHVKTLCRSFSNRDFSHPRTLDSIAGWIAYGMKPYADSVYEQVFSAGGVNYRNIVAAYGDASLPVLVIGAHYDVCENQEGADDNASGIAGLLELARLLDTVKLNFRVELVAYTLEEPPFFRTEQMGSFIHAQSLKQRNAAVIGMVSLEMIGYFSDEKRSQDYPLSFLRLLYGNRGNYITLVSTVCPGHFVRRMGRNFIHSQQVRTKKFRAPAALPGIDFSDHLNYWHFGYSAFMITDTAFYRNRNYHTRADTIEKLDFTRMAKTIDALLFAIVHF